VNALSRHTLLWLALVALGATECTVATSHQAWAGGDFCSLDCATANQKEHTPQDGVQVYVNENFYRKPSTETVLPHVLPVSPKSLPDSSTMRPQGAAGDSAGGAASGSAGAKSAAPGIQPRQPRGSRQGRQPRVKFSPRA
jgi:hypothetical protein